MTDRLRTFGARAARVIAPLSLAALLAAGSGATALAQAKRPAGVGPNGEVDGLTAKFTDVGGVSTRYYDYGKGEVIVLVHGGMGMGMSSTANNWSLNILGLAKRFRVLAVDRVGQGMTSVPADEKLVTTQYGIEHVYQFIRKMTTEKVHLVGHSSGSRLAFDLALAHPEVIKTMSLIAPGGGLAQPANAPPAPPAAQRGPSRLQAVLDKCPPPPSREYSYCRLMALEHVKGTFPADYAAADEWMGAQPPAVATQKLLDARKAAQGAPPTPGQQTPEQQAQAALRAAASEKVKNGVLSMPILIVHGMQDGLAWRASDPWRDFTNEMGLMDAVGQGGKNPKVSMVVMNESGHFPYRDHPAAFNAYLMTFIDIWNAGAAAK
jgi:2-hydroxy-6-oxonona-2,4-dienedioate hydrolase